MHLGVTEAGEGEDGRMKSAIGIGSLLADGLGAVPHSVVLCRVVPLLLLGPYCMIYFICYRGIAAI